MGYNYLMKYDWESSLNDLIESSLQRRLPLLDDSHQGAFRLLNGFTEGLPALAADIYGQTLVLFTHKVTSAESDALLHAACEQYTRLLPWVKCAIGKQRSAEIAALKRGEIIFGDNPTQSIIENGITYSIDLLMNQDASFYIDTRNLRTWLTQNSRDRDVLNTFAYTGSLGVAALAGGARRVVQLDRNSRFLEMAARSAAANHLDLGRMKSRAVDFFVGVGQLKQHHEEFDIVVLDPPYFSITEKGKVDLATESGRLINKVRPLLRDGGKLIVVNNALFLSGSDFTASLEELGKDGYLTLEERIDIPQDFTGYTDTCKGTLPADPAPFNHSTKIAVLGVKRRLSALN